VLLTTTNVGALQKRAADAVLNFFELGKVGGKRLILHYEDIQAVNIAVDELESAWGNALPKLLS
jgi:hypothetical protein